MRNRRLYQLLSLLSSQELADFEQYLRSPVFHPGKRILEFFLIWMEKVQLNEEDEEISPETLMEGSRLQPARIDKYCSKLAAVVIDYLGFLEFRKSGNIQADMQMKALENRKAGGAEISKFRQKIARDIKRRKISPERELKLMGVKWEALSDRIQGRETQELWRENFSELHHHLDAYYRLQKLRLFTASANARKIFKISASEADGDQFLKDLQQNPETQTPLIQAYAYCREMIVSEEGEHHFTSLLEILESQGHTFGTEILAELYGYALNFCIRKSNLGDLRYRAHSARLYRDLVENELILQDGKIPSHVLKNIVVIHCVLGETQWVKGFLEEYKDRVSEDLNGQAIPYNLAILAFYEEDYAAAIGMLNEVIAEIKEDVFYQIDARTYLWKSYFEHFEHLTHDEVDKMFRLYDSFRIFIDRNQQISESHKQQYRNFIREFRRFMLLLERKPISPDLLREFEAEIRGMDYMANKGWFLAKIHEIQEKIS